MSEYEDYDHTLHFYFPPGSLYCQDGYICIRKAWYPNACMFDVGSAVSSTNEVWSFSGEFDVKKIVPEDFYGY